MNRDIEMASIPSNLGVAYRSWRRWKGKGKGDNSGKATAKKAYLFYSSPDPLAYEKTLEAEKHQEYLRIETKKRLAKFAKT